MKILIIGATGTIGGAVVTVLSPRHDEVPVSWGDRFIVAILKLIGNWPA